MALLAAPPDIATTYHFDICEVPHPSERAGHRSFSRQRSKQIRRRLEALDPDTGAMFEARPSVYPNLPFRLLIDKRYRQDDAPTSFVALSYCWHNEKEWKPVSGCARGASRYHKDLPISDRCFREVLGCLHPREGIWIDQLCIRQADEEEKAKAIASMDLIYKNARLVVVVLEDIELTEDETSLATELQRLELAKDADAFKAVLKNNPQGVWGMVGEIGSSRWFRRAWCSHEFHLCQDAVFVIPCRGRRSAVSLGLGAFQDALMRRSEWVPASADSPADWLEGYQAAVRLLASRFVNFHHIISDPPIYGIGYLVNSLQSSRCCDKVSIALNLLGLRLSFRGRDLSLRGRDLSEAHARHTITLLALASGDPLMLCCTGAPLGSRGQKMEGTGLDISCLRWPDQGDLVHINNRYPTAVPALCNTIHLKGGRMEMDVFGIRGMDREPRAADVGRARSLLRALFKLYPDMLAKLEHEEFAHPVLDQDKFFECSVNYLACALHLGPVWISEALGNLGCLSAVRGLRACPKANFGDSLARAAREYLASTSGWDDCRGSSFVNFIPFALQHVLQLGLTARRITTVSCSWGAMASLPPDCNVGGLVAVVPAMISGPRHSFIKRLWLLERERQSPHRGPPTAYRIRDKGYVWGCKRMKQSRRRVMVSD